MNPLPPRPTPAAPSIALKRPSPKLSEATAPRTLERGQFRLGVQRQETRTSKASANSSTTRRPRKSAPPSFPQGHHPRPYQLHQHRPQIHNFRLDDPSNPNPAPSANPTFTTPESSAPDHPPNPHRRRCCQFGALAETLRSRQSDPTPLPTSSPVPLSDLRGHRAPPRSPLHTPP